MPRTQINFPLVVKDPAAAMVMTGGLPGSPVPAGTYVGDSILHVTWSPASKGAHVQVALEVDQGYAKMALEHPNGESPVTTYLYSPALDRAQINKLIAALRHARDQAHGKDE